MISGPAFPRFRLGLSLVGSPIEGGFVRNIRVEPGPLAQWTRDGLALLPPAAIPVDAFVDAVARTPGFRCCNVVAGLEIDVDGRDWTGGTVAHVGETIGWVEAGARLVDAGDPGDVHTWVWSQSSLHLARQGRRLVLEDPGGQWPEDPFTWRPLETLYEEFCHALAEEARELQAACERLREALGRRGMSEAEAARRLAGLSDMTRTEGIDPELAFAIAWRELGAGRGLDSSIARLAKA